MNSDPDIEHTPSCRTGSGWYTYDPPNGPTVIVCYHPKGATISIEKGTDEERASYRKYRAHRKELAERFNACLQRIAKQLPQGKPPRVAIENGISWQSQQFHYIHLSHENPTSYP